MIFLCACINSSSIFVFEGANKFLHLRSQFALVAELVDALDSKSSFFGSVGSIPTQGTKARACGLFFLNAKFQLKGIVNPQLRGLAPNLPYLGKTNG